MHRLVLDLNTVVTGLFAGSDPRHSDIVIKAAGFSIIVFNIITTFCDVNYHKNKSK
ncbi:hypothetical protein WSO01_04690 [Weissella soli]|nr:hypothetical protein WSO01_04690 [Weissella soli]